MLGYRCYFIRNSLPAHVMSAFSYCVFILCLFRSQYIDLLRSDAGPPKYILITTPIVDSILGCHVKWWVINCWNTECLIIPSTASCIIGLQTELEAARIYTRAIHVYVQCSDVSQRYIFGVQFVGLLWGTGRYYETPCIYWGGPTSLRSSLLWLKGIVRRRRHDMSRQMRKVPCLAMHLVGAPPLRCMQFCVSSTCVLMRSVPCMATPLADVT